MSRKNRLEKYYRQSNVVKINYNRKWPKTTQNRLRVFQWNF